MVLEADIEGYIMFVANAIGWSTTEVQVYVAHLRHEMRSLKFRPYYRQRVIWGRKSE